VRRGYAKVSLIGPMDSFTQEWHFFSMYNVRYPSCSM
jgi:hypothetical protein